MGGHNEWVTKVGGVWEWVERVQSKWVTTVSGVWEWVTTAGGV